MSDQQNGPSAQDRMVMDREARALERRRAKMEAMKNSLDKSLAQAIADDRQRQLIAKDALNAMEQGKRGNVDPTLREMSEVGGRFSYDDNDVITGLEPAPWDSGEEYD